MTGIWVNKGEGWDIGAPQKFPDEATLHGIIEKNPQLLPLAGSPRLAVLGSEVTLGNGYADIFAIEPTGRPVIIEVKLARNAEAKRNIVSQILAYAAFLHETDVETLEQGTLHRHLEKAGHESILAAVKDEDQQQEVDEDSFNDALQEYLDTGNFRLVLVLDEVSDELVRIVGYLDAITVQGLTIDLITVSIYEVNGAKIALPQRVTSEVKQLSAPERPRTTKRGVLSEGSDVFQASTEGATGKERKTFDDLIKWAKQMAMLPMVRLSTNAGKAQYSLLPRIMPRNAGLVTLWNYKNQPSIGLWDTVFEHLAPNSMESVEKAIYPNKIGHGNTIYKITPELLDALTAAYKEATGG